MRREEVRAQLQNLRAQRLPGRPTLILIAAISAVGLAVAACQPGSGNGASGSSGSGSSGKSSAAGPAVKIGITPANGTAGADPSKGISVSAAGGKLTSVHVTAGGIPAGYLTGAFNSAKTSWHTTWALPVNQRVSVTANAVTPSGHPVTKTSTFKTLNPAHTFSTEIFEGYGDTYGVGMPIMLTFSHPITNRAAVERALTIRTSKHVVGVWYWDNSQTLAFRPRTYWPAHTTVSFIGHLNGVEGAPGVYGFHTLTQWFKIGKSLIVVASTRTHHMKLYSDGKVLRRWPISTGRPGDNTPDGTYLTIDKGNPVLMVGPGYRIEVPWSVRITWSGDYLHDAYWSVGEQGFTNVSHGCVNMPPAAAKFYYKLEKPGDPVTITGSPRPGLWDNGWTYWFKSWPQILKGSALHKAVISGPQGSSFVSPGTVPATTAKAPLGTSAPGNSNRG